MPNRPTPTIIIVRNDTRPVNQLCCKGRTRAAFSKVDNVGIKGKIVTTVSCVEVAKAIYNLINLSYTVKFMSLK